MLNFRHTYAHEVCNAVVDFAHALSEGEALTGQPTVAVMKGDLAVSAARIERTALHFTLSSGTSAAKPLQWVKMHCPTNGDQVLEEAVSVTMLSRPIGFAASLTKAEMTPRQVVLYLELSEIAPQRGRRLGEAQPAAMSR